MAVVVLLAACAASVVGDAPSVQVCGGRAHTCALLRYGNASGAGRLPRVRCWGSGGLGQLGRGTTQTIGDDEPAYASGDVALGNGVEVASLACGYDHTCTLDSAGAVRCWGGNYYGQLGYGNTQNIGDNELPSVAGVVPMSGAVKLLAGYRMHTCALLTDSRSLRCWGYGGQGRLGYGNENNIGDNETPQSLGTTYVSLGSGAVIDGVVVGGAHSCALRAAGGDVKCWGYSSFAANTFPLGIYPEPSSSIGDGPSEMPPNSSVGNIPGSYASVAKMVSGSYHTVVLRSGGELWGWGNNSYGQLGLGNTYTATAASAVQMGFASDVTCGDDFSCATTSPDRLVRCWGRGQQGQLGYGNTLQQTAPPAATVAVVPVGIAGAVAAIGAGTTHVCVVMADTLAIRCWGANADGQLGLGHTSTIGDNETPATSGNVLAFCNDGYRLPGEQCDDGNNAPGDGCAADCTIEPYWNCAGQPSVCRRCGDGSVDVVVGEQCDDGGTADGDGCSQSCRIEPYWNCAGQPSVCRRCGDGSVDAVVGEQCDDGGTADGDGCSQSCRIEPYSKCNTNANPTLCARCGDGAIGTVLGELCDDGNVVDGDGCSTNCSVIDASWHCASQPSVCRRCGDGSVDAVVGEECDDGADSDGDGCSAACIRETSWSCVGQPSVCYRCGNGVVNAVVGEQCDDGDAADGDGCSQSCRVEATYACNTTSQPSACYRCGDGSVEFVEECDDGDNADGDGCSASCRVEDGWVCSDDGGGPSACSLCGDGRAELSEACDDGNLADGDGCSGVCRVEFGYGCTGSGPDSCAVFNLLLDDVSVGIGRSGIDPLLVLAAAAADSATAAAKATVDDGVAAQVVLRFNLAPVLAQIADGMQLPAVTLLQLLCLQRSSTNSVAIALATGEVARHFVESELTLDNGGAELVRSAVPQVLDGAYWRRSGELLLDISTAFAAAIAQADLILGDNVTLVLSTTATAAVQCYAKEYNDSLSTAYARLSWRATTAGLADPDSGGGSSGGAGSSVVIGATLGSIAAAALLCCALAATLLLAAAAVTAALYARRLRARRAMTLSAAPAFGMATLEANAFEINARDLKMTELLGRGASGQVYRGTWRKAAVAIKRITAVAGNIDADDEELLRHEAALWAKLQHPNVVRFYGLAAAGMDLLLVCELMPGGSLDALLHGNDDVCQPPPLPATLLLSLAVDAARGLVYLHHERVVHRDFKPANLLISADNHIKLADFGVARIRLGGVGTSTMTSVGTPHYMAPELIRGDAAAGLPLDIYSFGIVLWEMATRRRPYTGLAPAQVIAQAIHGLRPAIDTTSDRCWDALPPQLPVLIARCWHEDARLRPTASELMHELEGLS